eukprot:Opistho-1_new@96976
MFTHFIIPPEEEEQRLSALYSYDILGDDLVEEIDNLVKLAAQIASVPIAYLSFVDRNQVLLKSTIGVATTFTSVPRESSICQYTMMSDDIFIIPDVTVNEDVLNTPSIKVNEGVHFYASAPLK